MSDTRPADIDDIARRVAAVYEPLRQLEPKIENAPTEVTVQRWAAYARDYIESAGIIERTSRQHWLPVIQLTGHAIECALKACIAGSREPVPRTHDLVELLKLAQAELREAQVAMICHISRLYFKDFQTNAEYKSRYPDNTSTGGSLPGNETMAEIVERLGQQAIKRANLGSSA